MIRIADEVQSITFYSPDKVEVGKIFREEGKVMAMGCVDPKHIDHYTITYTDGRKETLSQNPS